MERNFKGLIIALIAVLFFAAPALAADLNGYRRSSTLTHGQTSCGNTATSIFSGSNSRNGFVINNNSGMTVYIADDSGVTTANGVMLANGQTLSDDGLHAYQGPLYCIVASGSGTISWAAKSW